MWEKLIPKVKLRLNMYNSCLIQLLFTKKNNFFTKFSSNFELSIKFTQIKKVRFIDVIIPLRSVSTNVSNCIVLNFMYTKFQVSSSKKWQSYWYSNMVHLLLITLYLGFNIHSILIAIELVLIAIVAVAKFKEFNIFTMILWINVWWQFSKETKDLHMS